MLHHISLNDNPSHTQILDCIRNWLSIKALLQCLNNLLLTNPILLITPLIYTVINPSLNISQLILGLLLNNRLASVIILKLIPWDNGWRVLRLILSPGVVRFNRKLEFLRIMYFFRQYHTVPDYPISMSNNLAILLNIVKPRSYNNWAFIIDLVLSDNLYPFIFFVLKSNQCLRLIRVSFFIQNRDTTMS